VPPTEGRPEGSKLTQDDRPTAVVALGGNALLPRGQAPEAALQLRAARRAAGKLASMVETHRLVVTHGNGPQVGLLALMNDAYGEVDPYPLDVLDAESAGQIGYVIELEIDNATRHAHTVTLITRVVVDESDPAFENPGKFIGPVYDRKRAESLAATHGWSVKADGDAWRRVVPSPEPQSIVQIDAIRELVDSDFIVVCAGGGGIPVAADGDRQRGVEAVIDKDLCSAKLAVDLEADLLVMATDVDAVSLDWGGAGQRAIGETTPHELRQHDFAEGSMKPKVEAACRMVESTSGRAAIGALDDLEHLLDGSAGTQVRQVGTSARSTDGEIG
jgi:carbamate kinase